MKFRRLFDEHGNYLKSSYDKDLRILYHEGYYLARDLACLIVKFESVFDTRDLELYLKHELDFQINRVREELKKEC